jgi:regulator of nucleoside diphosphate kinase
MKNTTMKNKPQKQALEQQGNIMMSLDDYSLLCDIIRNRVDLKTEATRHLATELKRARLVDKKALPSDVIRVNSRVKIRELNGKNSMELILVLPSEADIRAGKISVFAPVGTAILGFRKGDMVNWEVPAGMKSFIIEDVDNN